MAKQLTNDILSDATAMSVSGAESSIALDINKQDALGSLGIETVPQEESLEDGNPGEAYYQGEAIAPRELIIEFEPELTRAQIDGIKSDMSGINDTEYVIPNSNIHLVTTRGDDIGSFILEHQDDSGIKSIGPNYIITISKTDDDDELTPSDNEPKFPNDPGFPQLWGLHNTGQFGGKLDSDINAPEAWGHQTGSKNVVVGVIDTGIDYTHPDLEENMWTNQAELNGEANFDDDNNGYVDDIYGYDFAYKDGDPEDVDGHGTHVAGTIGAKGDNDIGVVGVNHDVSLMALKFLDDDGSGYIIDAIEAIKYATLMEADLTNNSWGGGGYSQVLKDTIEDSPLFFAAAGNLGDDNDKVPIFPASYDLENIVAVASTDLNDDRSEFSNYGANSVDLGAPGSSIVSTVPEGQYASKSGTSMATPHVAGVGALLLAEDPKLTDEKVKEIILDSVDKIDALNGITVTGGRLNAHEALLLAKGDPGEDPEIVIDFESLKHEDKLIVEHDFLYEEDGFVLKNLSKPYPFSTFGTQEPRFSGSTALFNKTVNGITSLSAKNEKPFDLDSIALTELISPSKATVTFEGELEKGGTVTQAFTLDGKAFEPETFTFSNDFDEVLSVTWTQEYPYHQFDNITIKQGSEDDPLEIIEDNGKASFAKHKEDGSYWAINNKTKEELQLTNKKNELITDEDSDEWDGVAVELKTKKGKYVYQLLLDGDGDNEDNAVVWKANDEGVIKKQKLKWVTKEKKIFKLEKKFEYDINGDGTIGKPKKDKNDLNDDDQIVGASQESIKVLEEFNGSDGHLSASFDGVTSDFSLGIGAEGISMSDSLMSVLDTTEPEPLF